VRRRCWAGVGYLFLVLVASWMVLREPTKSSSRNRLLPQASVLAQAQLKQSYGQIPLGFEVHQAQGDSQVGYLAHGRGYTLFLTANEAVLALRTGGREPNAAGRKLRIARRESAANLFASSGHRLPFAKPGAALPEPFFRPVEASTETLRLRLVGANPQAEASGLNELQGKSNYFIGNDPKTWRTNVANYAKVKFANVYPGVDMVYYGNHQQLEYDFVVHPGGGPKAIALIVGWDGVRPALVERRSPPHLDAEGNLVIAAGGGEVVFHKPVVYQPATDGGQLPRRPVEGKYIINDGNRITFEVGSYDTTRPLVIDPSLAYSSYLGGSAAASASGVAVDAMGNAYVAGYTTSADFPVTAKAFQAGYGGGSAFGDAFVTKLNPSGTALVYSTFLGGSADDMANGIAVDAEGNAYITGSTASGDFPTTQGAFQTTFGGGTADAFVSKLDASGSALVYSTYLGGNGYDFARRIAVDAAGDAVVIGSTESDDYPATPETSQPCGPSGTGGVNIADAMITKLNPAGSSLIYSNCLNTPSFPQQTFDLSGLALDATGNAYVAGAAGLAFSDASFTPLGAVVGTMNGSGSAFNFVIPEQIPPGNAIALDASGNIYITGSAGIELPTTSGAFQTAFGGGPDDQPWDAFVLKMSPSFNFVYCTYLGGSGTESGDAIAVDASGDAYVSGETGSSNFPISPDAAQTAYRGDIDAFVAKLNPAGSALLYSTYLGGSSYDEAQSLAIDPLGNLYVAGVTSSADFLTTLGAFQTQYTGNGDAFVSKFSFGIPFSSFEGKLEVGRDHRSFDLEARFTLGAGGSIDPSTQPVTLTIGDYTATIPAGSFVEHGPTYEFRGVINGAFLEFTIVSGRTSGSYILRAQGRRIDLTSVANPVTVTLAIGNNLGATQIATGSERTGEREFHFGEQR